MGSSESTKLSSPLIKKQESIMSVSVKASQIENPQQPVISEFVAKEAIIQRQLNPQLISEIEQLNKKATMLFENKFMLKVALKQIRLIFEQQSKFLNMSVRSSNHSQESIKELSRKCFYDLQVYRQICNMKMKCLITQHLTIVHFEDHMYLVEKQKIEPEANSMIIALIGEIEGKSSIWHSLNLTKQQKIMNLIFFLDQQGIDSSTFEILKQKHSKINDFRH